MLLILAIIITISSLFTIFSAGLLGFIATILTIVGLWQVYAMGKGKAMKPNGPRNLRTAITLNYVQSMLLYVPSVASSLIFIIGGKAAADYLSQVFNLKIADGIWWIVGIAILLPSIIGIVFESLYYNSIKKALNSGIDILSGKFPTQMGGTFAAVVMFIRCLPNLAISILLFIFSGVIASTVGNMLQSVSINPGTIVLSLILSGVGNIVGCAGNILAGCLILKYNSQLKNNN